MRQVSKALLVAVVSASLSACTSSGATPAIPLPSTLTAPSSPGCALPLGQQEVLLAAGANPNAASLFRLNLCTLLSRRIAGTERTSVVSAGGKGIVAVANARDGVDTLFLLQNDKLVAVPGLGKPAALAPAVSDRGQISYVTHGTSERDAYQVHVWTPGLGGRAGNDRIIYRSNTTTPTILTGWTLEGKSVASETPEVEWQSAGPARLLILDGKGGVSKRIPLRLPLAGPFLWSANGLVAIGESDVTGSIRSGRTLQSRDDSLAGVLPAGWTLHALSPDKRILLLTKDGQVATADATVGTPKLRILGQAGIGTIISGSWTM